MSEIIFRCNGHEFNVVNKGHGWTAEVNGIVQFWYPRPKFTLEKALLDLEVMIEDNELKEFAL